MRRWLDTRVSFPHNHVATRGDFVFWAAIVVLVLWGVT